VIDTTGTHPDLALCHSAASQVTIASATLAALPATIELGNVAVRSGEIREIDVTGSPLVVLNFDSLQLVGSRTPCFQYGYNGGVLDIRSDPAAEVVVNVRRSLDLGDCSYLAGAAIVNAAGRGPTVRVGTEVATPIAILAPDRKLVVKGGDADAG